MFFRPFFFINSSGVPSSTTFPFSNTIKCDAFATVRILWAIMITVFFNQPGERFLHVCFTLYVKGRTGFICKCQVRTKKTPFFWSFFKGQYTIPTYCYILSHLNKLEFIYRSDAPNSLSSFLLFSLLFSDPCAVNTPMFSSSR